MDKKLPEASENIEPFNQPLEYEDRKKWPWWKVFILVLHVPISLINRSLSLRNGQLESCRSLFSDMEIRDTLAKSLNHSRNTSETTPLRSF